MRGKRQETREGGGGKETNGWVGLSLASLWPGKMKYARIPVCESSGRRVGKKKRRPSQPASYNHMQTDGIK
jgi:hypothetical protein